MGEDFEEKKSETIRSKGLERQFSKHKVRAFERQNSQWKNVESTTRQRSFRPLSREDKKRKLGWVAGWKREHCVNWSCKTCTASNEYGTTHCLRCGKVAPDDANLQVEPFAARMIQRKVREVQSRRKLSNLAKEKFIRRFDTVTLQVYYECTVNGYRWNEKPRLLRHRREEEIRMDERDEITYKDHLEKVAQKQRLKLAFAEREEKRKIEREEKHREEERRAQEALALQWRAPFIQAERNGELIANWQGFTRVDPHVWELGPRLVVVRMIGNPFGELPGSLFNTFSNVRVLNLSNCDLVRIPDEITDMINLVDLNLMRNKLTLLPDAIGNLTHLEAIHLARNELKTLPESFGKLKRLPRINLEQNPLVDLPATFVELQCRIITLSKMSLRSLPKELGSMACTLMTLTLDHNKLRRIPRSIGELKKLEHLSLCDNQLRTIPDELCKCESLQRLWLDWNQIAELPADFLQLENLVSLHMEGNPMKMPEMEVIVKGVPAVRNWFQSNVVFYLEKERKTIVLHLQAIFATMYDEDMHLPQFYEPGWTTKEIGEKRDMYHAFVPSYLFSYVIPTWNSFVESLMNHPQALDRKLRHFAKRKRHAERKDEDRQEKLERTIFEQLEALEKQTVEIIEEEQLQKFQEEERKREAKEKRKVSDKSGDKYKDDTQKEQGEENKPGDGKKDDDSNADAEGDLFTANLKMGEEEEARKKLEEDLKHRKAALLEELEELENADQEFEGNDEKRLAWAKHLIAMVPRTFEPFEYTEEEVEDALEHFQDSYGRTCIKDQLAMFRQCACERDGEPRICVPPSLDFRCERKATLLKISPVTMVEKTRRESVNLEEKTLKERLEKVEQDANEYFASPEGRNLFNGLAKEQAQILLEEERKEHFILLHRLKLSKMRQKETKKRLARKKKFEEAKQARIEQLEKKKNKLLAVLERSRGWEAKEIKDKIKDVEDELENHPQDVEIEILEMDQERANERFEELGRAERILQKYRPRSELFSTVHEMMTATRLRRVEQVRKKLMDGYIHVEKKRARMQIRREFRISRRIMYNWMNLNVRMTFVAWKEWVQSRLYWKKHLAMQEESQREIEKASSEMEAIYRQAERAKWIESFDPFSDKPFWQHNETGEVRWEEPRLEDCVFIPRRRLLPVSQYFGMLEEHNQEEQGSEENTLVESSDPSRGGSSEFVEDSTLAGTTMTSSNTFSTMSSSYQVLSRSTS